MQPIVIWTLKSFESATSGNACRTCTQHPGLFELPISKPQMSGLEHSFFSWVVSSAEMPFFSRYFQRPMVDVTNRPAWQTAANVI